ncbi:MAG: hypothetical protein RL108_1952 [Bacteroidota bacterium]|jgi:hypothetical protein
MSTKILICTHKEFNYIPDNSFLPIHVGKEISAVDLPYQADNIGINISAKNKNYCELTALYWAWKNLHEITTVGLCHYRRFFDFSETKTANEITDVTEDYFSNHFQNYCYQENKLEGFDIILPKKIIKTRSLYSHYSFSHLPEDFDILEKTVIALYPEYEASFKKILFETNSFSPFNMFVASRELTADYANWLFTILEKVEQQIKISTNPYQERVLGFMSERLLNVYVDYNQLKIMYLPVHFVAEKNKSKSLLKQKMVKYNNNILFWFRTRLSRKK